MRRERALAVDDSQAAGDRSFGCPLVVSFFEVMATQIVLEFSPLVGEMIQFDEHIFQRGWFNHQPDVFFGWVSFLIRVLEL